MMRLVSRSEGEAAWFEARRQGFTASEANRVLTPSGRRAILREKVTGEGVDLSRVAAIRWGKAREAAVMVWVEERFGIPANDWLWSGENPNHRATPDGLLVEDGVPVAGCEVKTGVDEMSPGMYQPQIQWTMHVFGLSRWLLVWERNDGGTPPTPLGEPEWIWVDRDQDIIDQLVAEADALLAEAGRSSREDVEPVILDDSDEVAYLAGQVLDARLIEARGKELKEDAWKKLRVALEGKPDDQWLSGVARVTWSTTPGCQTSSVDLSAMEAEAPDVVEAYRALQARHTTIATGKPSRNLTITRKETP